MKYLFCLFFLFSLTILAQQKTKSVEALRIKNAPNIDGELNEPFWKEAQPAKDFVMFRPGDGNPERPNKKTVVKIAYDDEAIYIGATMYDDKPEEIPMQFTSRDEFGITDFFGVEINPENDKQNDTEFILMSTGTQADAKLSPNNEDFSWNAVWKSAVKLNKNSWTAEIKIPYSALRFNNNTDKPWGINFTRKINKLDEQYVWNYVDKKVGTFTQYSGELTNIKNIKPPTRLSFSPYASTTNTNYDGTSDIKSNIGMDVKYGINESFTLDAVLVPDFGQTAFDDQVLNLGPFEHQYAEKRAFFTEGTELFSKGDLFYSRRIGDTPIGYDNVSSSLNPNEEIIDNPSKVNMLNAVKISGRTSKGLGIGFFNAVTERTSAKIKNVVTNEIRTVVTEPLANYNVLVLDQQFNKNSSVSFVNTSVLRSGSFRDSNVSAFIADLANKNNKYGIYADFKLSNVRDAQTKIGYAATLFLKKISGKIQYEIGHWESDKKFDINDLGYQSFNNYSNYYSEVSYRIFEPTKHFNSINLVIGSTRKYQKNPNKFAEHQIEFNSSFVTRKRFAFGGGIETFFGNRYDFYEPRVEGRFYKETGYIALYPWISTDYRKKFAIDIHPTLAIRYASTNRYMEFNISPRYRFNDKFQIIYSLNFTKEYNKKGWVENLDNGSIIFGNRDTKTIINSISGKLSFSTKSSLSLSFRHYWSPVHYNTFYELNNNGTLDPSTYSKQNDINYNIWNLDLNYSWEFAPGSQLVALYRNSIFNSDELSQLSFNENLTNLFKQPKTNIFSLKLIYYLDYNKVKSWI